MTVLHIIPEGGLANRLRALASAMWLADTHSVPLVLTWPKDFMIAVPFDAIFTSTFDRDAGSHAGKPTLELTNPPLIGIDSADDPRGELVITVRSCQPFSYPGGPRTWTRAFWSALRPYLISLTPVEEVRRRVAAVSRNFVPTMVGVHVRSAAGPVMFDRADRIDVVRFFRAIDRILAVEKNAHIFLAADSAGVLEQFGKRYGAIVITAAPGNPAGAPGAADDVERLRMALADLLLLSKTTFLLGSFYSSFSELAGVIGAIPTRRLGGKFGEPGGEMDLAFFVEQPLPKRAAWRLRSLRHRRFFGE